MATNTYIKPRSSKIDQVLDECSLKERIIFLRTEQKMSRVELARKMNVHLSNVYDLERFDRDIKLSTITKLAQAFGVSYDTLIGKHQARVRNDS